MSNFYFPIKILQEFFKYLITSDESEPSWLEPELELKDFQLGSARLVTFFDSARMQKLAKKEPKMSQNSILSWRPIFY